MLALVSCCKRGALSSVACCWPRALVCGCWVAWLPLLPLWLIRLLLLRLIRLLLLRLLLLLLRRTPAVCTGPPPKVQDGEDFFICLALQRDSSLKAGCLREPHELCSSGGCVLLICAKDLRRSRPDGAPNSEHQLSQ